MKKNILLLNLLCVAYFSIAQDSGYNFIDANNIKTGLHSNGSLFFNETFQVADFVVPYVAGQPEVSTIFASGIWISGIDENGNVDAAAVTYPSPNTWQFTSGPLNASTINVDFKKVWKVYGSEIKAHIQDFADGAIDNTPAENILQWPAKGNPFYNGALDGNQEMAPYFDKNGNGLYDPMNGDLPVIGNDLLDVVPDQMLYTVFNGNHPNLFDPMDIDVHTVMYALDCPQEEVLQNTVFTRHTFINSGNKTYSGFRVAQWMDADLGCYTDDYIGCDTLHNSFYAYNQDLIDGEGGTSFCTGGVNTYADNPPVQSTVFLNQKMESFTIINNASLGIPPPGTSSPVTPEEYNHFMNGRFGNGGLMTVGNSGHDPSSTDYTKFQYPGDPNKPNEWSMYTTALPFSDRRSVSSTGLDTYQPQQIFSLDLAHNFTQNSNLNNIETITEAKINWAELHTIYDSKFDGTCAIFSGVDQPALDHIKVFPNPTTDVLVISQSDDFHQYTLLDKLGRSVKTGILNPAKTEITTSALRGMYVLQMENKTTGIQLNKKVIVL